MKDDFAEAAAPEERQSPPPEESPPPVPALKKLPDLKGALLRTRPFVSKAGRRLHAAGRVTARSARAVRHVLCVIGGALRRFFKKDSAPNMVLVLTVLASVTAAGLGVADAVAKPRIEAARAEAFDTAMGAVFPGLGLHFTPSSLGENLYEGRDETGELIGFAVVVSPAGPAGPVDMIVGVSALREVTGTALVRPRELRNASAAVEQGVIDALAAFDRGVRP